MRIDLDFFLQHTSFEFNSVNDIDLIVLKFPYEQRFTQFAKSMKARWNPKLKIWYIEDSASNREKFLLPNRVVSNRILDRIYPINKELFKQYIELLQLKAYSPNTIKTYTTELSQFLIILKSHSAKDLNSDDLRSYFLYCVNTLKMSETQMHSRINAVKFLYEKVLNKEKFFFEIPRPKKPSKIPKVLSEKDIQKIFDSVDNSKHLLMLKLCYGMGLRVSEVVNIKITDIDSSRMQVHIQSAKGKKDRYVNLPQSILEELRAYYREYKPQVYLFEGQSSSSQYSIRSVQQVFKKAMIKAKINKQVGIHGLRHSYATHLLEYGTDISFIQKLLGHKDIKTTLLYTNVSKSKIENIKSPLDRISKKSKK